MELRFDAMLYSNTSNENSDAGQIKCTRGPGLGSVPQVPHHWHIVWRFNFYLQCSKFKHAWQLRETRKYMKEHKDKYVLVAEKHTLDGTNTFTFMNHKHVGHTQHKSCIMKKVHLPLCSFSHYNWEAWWFPLVVGKGILKCTVVHVFQVWLLMGYQSDRIS